MLVCHRRFGKTVLAVMTLIDGALRFPAGRDGRFAYVAPYYRQAKQVAWLYFKKYCAPIPGARFNESELNVSLPNGALIGLHGSDNPDSMRGVYYDGVVMDEVATMRAEVWGEIVRPALTDRGGWALFIGTPQGMNQFHELYQEARTTPGWYAGMFRADETGVIPDSELELARSAMSDAEYRQEFLCDFGASSDNILITIDLVSRACKRAVVHEESLFGLPKVMGVDVARYGADSSVICRRHGHVLYEPVQFRKLDNMHIAGVVAREWDAWEPDAVFIDGGRGEGVIDRLRQLGYGPIEVAFGGRDNLIDKAHYADKRTEMYDLGRKWLEENGNLPNNSELKSQICGLTYDFSGPGGTMRLESKEKIRKDKRTSPDLADAWALTFAFPVSPRDKVDPLHETMAQPHMVTDYDPYPVEAA